MKTLRLPLEKEEEEEFGKEMTKFPVATDSEVKLIETKLKNKAFYKKVVSNFKHFHVLIVRKVSWKSLK